MVQAARMPGRAAAAVTALLVVSAVGAVHAIRRGRTCRFLAIPVPGTAVQHALTIGTPLSAPPIMLAGLATAARQGRTDVVRLLGAAFLLGILGEVDTWTTLRRPSADAFGTACVAAYVVLPAVLTTVR